MIFIRVEKLSPRLLYTLDFIFTKVLNEPYQCVDHTFVARDGDLLIHYGQGEIAKAVCIRPTGLLDQNEINDQPEIGGLVKIIMEDIERSTFTGCDIFSFVFYCLSRYEEYLPFNADVHGRFPATESLAFKHQFLQRALVDECIILFKSHIEHRYNRALNSKFGFKIVPTIDIDFAWAYKHKGFFRNVIGLFKDAVNGKKNEVLTRIKTLFGGQKDPYDISHILNMEGYNASKFVFFILCGLNENRFDKNHPVKNKYFRQLVKKLAESNDIGSHPSYRSNQDINFLEQEISQLRALTGANVDKSRQHYLKLSFPTTYQNLIKTGIEADYSMGYADRLGYRASTAFTYEWYDLSKEVHTDFKVIPFQIMDVTLKNYLQLSPHQAMIETSKVIRYSKELGLPICFIWHNSSMGEIDMWNGWQSVYLSMIQEAP